jgi:hypothetical protein
MHNVRFNICILGRQSHVLESSPSHMLSLSFTLSKHLKNASFLFIHCWLLLKDIPQWTKTKEANQKITPMTRPKPFPTIDVNNVSEYVS